MLLYAASTPYSRIIERTSFCFSKILHNTYIDVNVNFVNLLIDCFGEKLQYYDVRHAKIKQT